MQRQNMSLYNLHDQSAAHITLLMLQVALITCSPLEICSAGGTTIRAAHAASVLGQPRQHPHILSETLNLPLATANFTGSF
jgi:hypothetical protein